MVLCGNHASAALLLADGPELHVVVAAVDAVDVVGPAVAGECAFVLAARPARVVGAEVLEDICLAPSGPGVYREIAVASGVEGALELDGAVQVSFSWAIR